jgi:hypothetical protein
MSGQGRVARRMPRVVRGAILAGMANSRRAFTATSRPTAAARPRIRLMGLRRALAALEAGERANDRLHQWTITPRRAPLQPIRAAS